MIAQILKKLYTSVLNILFPVFCLGCSLEGEWICQGCLLGLKDFSYKNRLLKRAVQTFKYQSVRELAKPLGKLLRQKAKYLKYDYIIPVPLHKRRLRSRGFNQAELLAREIDSRLVVVGVLIKTRHTRPQMELKKEKRLRNLKGVFFVKTPEIIKDKRILLVDDVKTTGSTLKECEKTLLKAGAKKVISLTLVE